MFDNFFYSASEWFFNLQSLINSSPLWLRISAFALYSLAFGSLFGSILNRRLDPLKAAQLEREYVLLNYGTDIAPEIPSATYENQKNSICPKCRNKLRFYHNIPLISYALLGGKCGYCGEKISKSYPLIEFSIMAIMLLFGASVDFQLSIQCFWFLIFSISLVSICFTDIKALDVYDVDSFAFCVSGLSILNSIIAVSTETLLSSIYIVTVVALISSGWRKIRGGKDDAIGTGDLPLMAMLCSSILTFDANFQYHSNTMIFVVMILLVTPILNWLASLLTKKGFSRKIPFAPALTIGTFLILLTKGSVL